MIHLGQAATAVWMNQVSRLATMRDIASPRGMKTKEAVGCVLEISMRYPVVACPQRKLSYAFMAAEALWILSGSNSLDFHPEIRKKLEPYSDDGHFMAGAYGPPFIEQFPYAVRMLREDPDTRQAVVMIFSKSPPKSKDIPCTVAMQFMIRNKILHTNVFMRSSDAWMGLPYDIFSFSMMSMAVAIELGVRDLGRLTMMCGSSHLYDRNWEAAQEVIQKWDFNSTSPWSASSFGSFGQLLDHLSDLVKADDVKEWICDGTTHHG